MCLSAQNYIRGPRPIGLNFFGSLQHLGASFLDLRAVTIHEVEIITYGERRLLELRVHLTSNMRGAIFFVKNPPINS